MSKIQLLAFLLVVVMSILEKSPLVNAQCYQSAYVRPMSFISTCNSDEEKSGLLCYPKCRDNYFGNGPMCHEQCRDGYSNTGLTCYKAPDTYAKGCCCFFFNSCCHNCNDAGGYYDMGCTCTRKPDSYWADGYGRGVGVPLRCGSEQEQYMGMCYPKAKRGYQCTGPLCWINKCRGDYTYSCKLHVVCAEILLLGSAELTPLVGVTMAAICESHGLMCTKDADQCVDINKSIAEASFGTISGIAEAIATEGVFFFFL